MALLLLYILHRQQRRAAGAQRRLQLLASCARIGAQLRARSQARGLAELSQWAAAAGQL
jgi:hypothetical protein